MEALDPKTLSFVLAGIPYRRYLRSMQSYGGQRTHETIINNHSFYLLKLLELRSRDLHIVNNIYSVKVIKENPNILTNQVLEEYRKIISVISSGKSLDTPIGLYNKYKKYLWK